MHVFFKPSHPNFMIFHAKNGILRKYLYVYHTLFILYLEGNYTLFGEKLYFIWKFSNGNTEGCIWKMLVYSCMCFTHHLCLL